MGEKIEELNNRIMQLKKELQDKIAEYDKRINERYDQIVREGGDAYIDTEYNRLNQERQTMINNLTLQIDQLSAELQSNKRALEEAERAKQAFYADKEKRIKEILQRIDERAETLYKQGSADIYLDEEIANLRLELDKIRKEEFLDPKELEEQRKAEEKRKELEKKKKEIQLAKREYSQIKQEQQDLEKEIKADSLANNRLFKEREALKVAIEELHKKGKGQDDVEYREYMADIEKISAVLEQLISKLDAKKARLEQCNKRMAELENQYGDDLLERIEGNGKSIPQGGNEARIPQSGGEEPTLQSGEEAPIQQSGDEPPMPQSGDEEPKPQSDEIGDNRDAEKLSEEELTIEIPTIAGVIYATLSERDKENIMQIDVFHIKDDNPYVKDFGLENKSNTYKLFVFLTLKDMIREREENNHTKHNNGRISQSSQRNPTSADSTSFNYTISAKGIFYNGKKQKEEDLVEYDALNDMESILKTELGELAAEQLLQLGDEYVILSILSNAQKVENGISPEAKENLINYYKSIVLDTKSDKVNIVYDFRKINWFSMLTKKCQLSPEYASYAKRLAYDSRNIADVKTGPITGIIYKIKDAISKMNIKSIGMGNYQSVKQESEQVTAKPESEESTKPWYLSPEAKAIANEPVIMVNNETEMENGEQEEQKEGQEICQ